MQEEEGTLAAGGKLADLAEENLSRDIEMSVDSVSQGLRIQSFKQAQLGL